MKPKAIYLVLCAIGFLVPYAAFVPWVAQHGHDMRLFASKCLPTASAPSSGWT